MTRQDLWEDIFKSIMYAYNSYPYDGDPDETWGDSVETEIQAAADVADAMVEKIMARRMHNLPIPPKKPVTLGYGLSDDELREAVKLTVASHHGSTRSAALDYVEANPDHKLDDIENEIKLVIGEP